MGVDKRDVDFDRNDLEREWNGHPSLYAKYALLAADARRDFDEAKAQLDLTRAELGLAIRSDPSEYQLSKVTETTVESAIVSQRLYKDALQDMIDARHHLEVCNGIVSSLDHRKVALQKSTELQLAERWSRPRVGVSQEVADEMETAAVRRRGRRERRDDD